MKTKEILDKIEALFKEKLEAKNGWGKNEVQSLYKDCVNTILKEVIDQIIKL
jgi:hypothetical protein